MTSDPYLRRLVDGAPPLTTQQARHLAALLVNGKHVTAVRGKHASHRVVKHSEKDEAGPASPAAVTATPTEKAHLYENTTG